ncbi:MAG: ABC transporter permease [Xanthomonadales bacterium]|nr:ABC transporter permease [Gammaproteobacteria bacterium]MBT8049874.1 ABC transporter permease [Gammaproteobacteria bacterium]MBT8057089.1 ABC transporter permease [Gammaproteobacteria bacterium]NNJ79377.1 ABC transporter permease [Xanthomonadales bacterium]NNL06018.1 ABC transporter permease [Xanthomonadales bacterium]
MREVMRPLARKLFQALLLVVGVTLISFLLMVWFGPDQTYTLIGKNATTEQIAEVRHQLGYDDPFLLRYGEYLLELVTLDLGVSNASGESVRTLLARTVPISLVLMIPGFVLGNGVGIALGLASAHRRGRRSDRLITALSVTGMSISFLVVLIAFQVLFSTPYGLDLFPVRGWRVSGWTSYLHYVTVPTLALLFVTFGYNTRFYRALFIEEIGRDHIRAARALGASESVILWKHVLKNSMVPIITRIMFSIPLVVISGSLLIESYFGIPGIGQATFEAITSGDQPVLKAVVGLTAVAFVAIQFLTELLCRRLDPRLG